MTLASIVLGILYKIFSLPEKLQYNMSKGVTLLGTWLFQAVLDPNLSINCITLIVKRERGPYQTKPTNTQPAKKRREGREGPRSPTCLSPRQEPAKREMAR